MSEEKTIHWLGDYTGTEIRGLYDPELRIAVSTPGRFSVGDIIEVKDTQTLYAASDSALNQILRILARYKLNPAHPPEVIQAAHAYKEVDILADPTLVDQTHLPFVTIDNPDSRDLDQAVFVSHDNSGFEVYYALADASWFVPTGTSLFNEALNRGVTYYAPDFSVRMLPAVLSEDLISLNEGVKRRAMTFCIRLAPNGDVLETTVQRAVIKSRAKLSYSQVQTFYDQNDTAHVETSETIEWQASLLAMRAVGALRIEDARRRDVVEFNRREAQVIIDPENQNKLIIVVRERNDAEKYNEQISLLCNIEGARLLRSKQALSDELQAVYRVHQPPMAMRLDDFRTTLQALIDRHGLNERFRWQSNESLADYIAGLPDEQEYSGLTQTIERMAMLTNRASTFESEPDQHYALGVDAYARFSSPMREIVGIFTHKELFESLGLSTSKHPDKDNVLRAQVIEKANETKKTQRKLEKEFQLIALECFLKQELKAAEPSRPWHPGVIVGMRSNRIYLHIDGLALEVKIYLEDLDETYGCTYSIDGIQAKPSSPAGNVASIREAPVLTMGNRIEVKVSSYDDKRRRYLFAIK